MLSFLSPLMIRDSMPCPVETQDMGGRKLYLNFLGIPISKLRLRNTPSLPVSTEAHKEN